MPKRSPGTSNPIVQRFAAFVSLGAAAKDLTTRQADLKNDLLDFAGEHGEPDEKGSLTYLLPAPIEDGFGKKYSGFTKQRRVSQAFNEDRAEAFLTEKGISRDLFISTQEYVDQDKVARLYAEDVITDAEFNALIDENISWAFVPVKAEA